MPDTATLALVLAAPPRARLGAALLARARAALDGREIVEEAWLAEGRVCQLLFLTPAGLAPSVLRQRIADSLADPSIDLALVPGDGAVRRKTLLVADMESTIIQEEMLDELADFIGARERIAAITERAMRGELDFETALRERVAMLAGLDSGVLDEVAGRITLMPGAETLARTMKRGGARLALVSGGFTVFTERVARRLGFDEHQANALEIAGGKLTGRVVEPVLGREAKRQALHRLARSHSIGPAATLAVGDGANDLDMLAAAGLGVAFRAKPKVRDAAAAMDNGAVVTHGDLTSLLYLQGYRDDELVA